MPFSAPHQPAHNFAQRHNLTGIHTDYAYPPEGWQALTEKLRHWKASESTLGEMARHLPAFFKESGTPPTPMPQLLQNDAQRLAFTEFLNQNLYTAARRMFLDLERLNPKETAKLEFDRQNPDQLLHVVDGILSGFTPRDINFFLKRNGSVRTPEDMGRMITSATEQYRRRAERKILNHLGEFESKGTGWIAAPETLRDIWVQVRSRPPAKTPDVIPFPG